MESLGRRTASHSYTLYTVIVREIFIIRLNYEAQSHSKDLSKCAKALNGWHFVHTAAIIHIVGRATKVEPCQRELLYFPQEKPSQLSLTLSRLEPYQIDLASLRETSRWFAPAD